MIVVYITSPLIDLFILFTYNFTFMSFIFTNTTLITDYQPLIPYKIILKDYTIKSYLNEKLF